MLISIIIPAFNEEKELPGALASVAGAGAALRERGWDLEVIVCDNNSTDRTAELARAAGARVVFEPVNQISRARNGGARAAQGDWLVFVDADSRPSAELFRALGESIASGDCVGGRLCHPIRSGPWDVCMADGLLESPEPVAKLGGRLLHLLRRGGLS